METPDSKRVVYIVTGPESTGSTLIAQIIACSLNLTHSLQDWNGRGQIGEMGENFIVLHRSQPSKTCGFISLSQFEDMFPGYELKFVLCTRDRNVSAASNFSRRGKASSLQNEEVERALSIMNDIMSSRHPFYVWSYETFMLLKNSYLKSLYDTFIGSCRRLDVADSLLVDGNAKFVVRLPGSHDGPREQP